MPAFHAVVQGRVQGIGFRWFVVREARLLGLHGRVKNLASGREVEVHAEGDEESLKALIGALRKGPAFSHVQDVRVNWLDSDDRFSEFDVAY